MPLRFAASSAFAFALLVPALALADVPPADGGAGGGGGAGGSQSFDPGCTVAGQAVAGTTCSECVVTSSDTNCQVQLGSDYSFVCQQTAKVQVWCNGPARTQTVAPACALRGAPTLPGSAGGAAVAAMLGVAAWALRRRRR